MNQAVNRTQYVGRFAPSPTGPLHLGSLTAAMASYCDARHNQGRWLLRIDDIDPPRELAGAAEDIQTVLKQYGMMWDGDVLFQSERSTAYREAIHYLNANNALYLCDCSRRKLQGSNTYPGYCRPQHTESKSKAKRNVETTLVEPDDRFAVRVTLESIIRFTDRVQGDQTFVPSTQFGDAIVLRKDNLFSYALACAVDDANGITHVVRGADLLSSTATQMAIMAQLNQSAPSYTHIPIAVNTQQQKLSKQTRAQAIAEMPIMPSLETCWRWLGQASFKAASIDDFWRTAIDSWDINKVPKRSQFAVAE